MTQWTTPVTPTVADPVGPTYWDPQVRDNLLYLYENLGASRGLFRDLQLRSHPDADVAATKVQLITAGQIVLSDGVGIEDWPVLTADLSAIGANGLDTGTEQASTWYEVHAIRKSSDGTRGLLLHRAPDIFQDESQASVGSNIGLRDASARTAVAQGFQIDETDVPLLLVAMQMQKVGTPTGQIYLTIETDSAGSPSGIILATSDKLDASAIITAGMQWLLFPFRAPATLTTGTQYHIRVNGTWAVSGANYVRVGTAGSGVYARGQVKSFDGASTWSGVADDATFTINVLRNQTAITMPSGYDQRALIGYVYNDSGSNLVPFEARGRRVIPLSAQQIFSDTLTTVTPIDLRTIVPPRPVTMRVVANVGAGGTIVKFAPMPGGYATTSAGAPRLGGSAGIVAANNHVAEIGAVHTEMQQAFSITNGAATVHLSEWEW